MKSPGLLILLAMVTLGGGCTRESVRIAIESQRRADDVQRAVVEQQHEAVCILLYRDLIARLQAEGVEMNEQQCAAVSDIWNDRDLAEFWLIQHERAAALRLVGVDAKLFADQAAPDLLLKMIRRKADRARGGLVGTVGELFVESNEKKED